MTPRLLSSKIIYYPKYYKAKEIYFVSVGTPEIMNLHPPSCTTCIWLPLGYETKEPLITLEEAFFAHAPTVARLNDKYHCLCLTEPSG